MMKGKQKKAEWSAARRAKQNERHHKSQRARMEAHNRKKGMQSNTGRRTAGPKKPEWNTQFKNGKDSIKTEWRAARPKRCSWGFIFAYLLNPLVNNYGLNPELSMNSEVRTEIPDHERVKSPRSAFSFLAILEPKHLPTHTRYRLESKQTWQLPDVQPCLRNDIFRSCYIRKRDDLAFFKQSGYAATKAVAA